MALRWEEASNGGIGHLGIRPLSARLDSETENWEKVADQVNVIWTTEIRCGLELVAEYCPECGLIERVWFHAVCTVPCASATSVCCSVYHCHQVCSGLQTSDFILHQVTSKCHCVSLRFTVKHLQRFSACSLATDWHHATGCLPSPLFSFSNLLAQLYCTDVIFKLFPAKTNLFLDWCLSSFPLLLHCPFCLTTS